MASYAHVVHTTAKQVISRHGKNENVCEMSKNEKRSRKACETIAFYRQICKFVTFLLPRRRRGCLSSLLATTKRTKFFKSEKDGLGGGVQGSWLEISDTNGRC